jgi:hypothetical protein
VNGGLVAGFENDSLEIRVPGYHHLPVAGRAVPFLGAGRVDVHHLHFVVWLLDKHFFLSNQLSK